MTSAREFLDSWPPLLENIAVAHDNRNQRDLSYFLKKLVSIIPNYLPGEARLLAQELCFLVLSKQTKETFRSNISQLNYEIFSLSKELRAFLLSIPEKRRKETENRPTSVLVVDDEKQIRSIIAETLGENGFSIDEAGSGRRALPMIKDKIKEGPGYDVVVTDLLMEDGDGFELMEEIRKLGSKGPRTIIIITAFPTLSDWEVQESGAHELLTKPFKIDEIFSAIKKREL